MKKILLIIVLMLLSINVFAQKIQFIDTLNGNPILREVSYKYPLPVRLLNFNNLLDTLRIGYLDKENTWVLPQIFRKAYIDSLIIRVYALDTGTNITRTILPQTTKLYDLGSSSTTWDTIFTKSLRFGNDTLGYLDNGKLFLPTYGTPNKPNIMFGSSNNGIYWDGTYMNFVTNGTLRMFLGANFIQTANLYPINSRVESNGTTTRYWLNSYTQNLYVDTIKSTISFTGTAYFGNAYFTAVFPNVNKARVLGYPGSIWKNTYTASLNLGIDSTGAKVDSVYEGRHTILVNCSNADSNVVWLSDYNVTEGQVYTVMKIDANATNVIVKSKSGYPINGAISKVWNTQWDKFTFAYRNKTWYVVNN